MNFIFIKRMIEKYKEFKEKLERKKYQQFIAKNRKTCLIYLKDTDFVVFKIVVIKLGEYDIYERVSWDPDDSDFYEWRKIEDVSEKRRIMGKIVRHNYKCYYHPYREHPDIELATPRCQYEFELQCLGLKYPYTWGWP